MSRKAKDSFLQFVTSRIGRNILACFECAEFCVDVVLRRLLRVLSLFFVLYQFSSDYVKKKVKAVCGSYSTAALRHIVLLPE